MRLREDGKIVMRVSGAVTAGRVVRMKYRIRDFPEYRHLTDAGACGMDLYRPFPDARLYYMEFGHDGFVHVVWASIGLLYPEGEGPNTGEAPPGD